MKRTQGASRVLQQTLAETPATKQKKVANCLTNQELSG